MRATPFDLTLLREYDVKFLLGDLRDDFLTGLWCSTYINTKLKPGTAPLKPTDFMPFHREKQPQQTTQQIAAALKAWARAHGAVIPKGK